MRTLACLPVSLSKPQQALEWSYEPPRSLRVRIELEEPGPWLEGGEMREALEGVLVIEDLSQGRRDAQPIRFKGAGLTESVRSLVDEFRKPFVDRPVPIQDGALEWPIPLSSGPHRATVRLPGHGEQALDFDPQDASEILIRLRRSGPQEDPGDPGAW